MNVAFHIINVNYDYYSHISGQKNCKKYLNVCNFLILSNFNILYFIVPEKLNSHSKILGKKKMGRLDERPQVDKYE